MTSLADWIFTKEADKNKKVLSTFSGEYSLADLEIKMHWFISLLNQEGNLKGKKVVILVPQIHSFLQILLAVNKLDGIVIPLSYQLREGDLQSILRFLDPHIIFSVKQFNGFNFETIITKWAESTGKQTSIYFSDGLIWSERYYFEGAPRLDETEEMDIIACTSGSTGVPKGIKLDNEYIIKNSMILASVLNIDKEDRVFQNINPSVAYGLMWLFSGLKVQFLTVAPEIFDVPKIVKQFQDTKPTKVSTTPSLFRTIFTFAQGMNAEDSFRELKICSIGGEMIPKELIDTLRHSLNCRLMSTYGTSEAGVLMYTQTDLRDGIEWEIFEDIDYKIVDQEIYFKTPKNFMGYYQRPDLTRKVLDEDGWYHTGDLVELNQRNKINLLGRIKQLIKIGGQSVLPGEIENTIMKYPNVDQVAVIGVPHPILGEEIIAFIAANEEVSTSDLKIFCSKELAAYKVPSIYVLIDEIPYTNGKIDRLALKNTITGMREKYGKN